MATADEVVAAYEAGRTVREIMEAAGRSRAWIYKQLTDRNVALGRRPRGPAPLQLPPQSIAEYENGATTVQLAEKYQRDVDAIAKFLRRNGVELRGRRRGPRIKVPDEVVDLYEQHGWSLTRLAERYSVSPATIRRRLNAATNPPSSEQKTA